ncbi:hypothetical protein CVU75_03290 [Candidatus Dependentiae bacterium HGW-Dependentiae-1]|nr:MAG: hypothetical protein CVU75_03290 [Candidatus Dependentiae bacterium HGW-Dependentiae-1]
MAYPGSRFFLLILALCAPFFCGGAYGTVQQNFAEKQSKQSKKISSLRKSSRLVKKTSSLPFNSCSIGGHHYQRVLRGLPCVERTVLARASQYDFFTWDLFSAQGFTLVDLDDLTRKTTLTSSLLSIVHAGSSHAQERDSFSFNGKKLLKKQLVIMPVSGSVWVQGVLVVGPLLFVRDDQGVSLIQYCAPISPVFAYAQQFLLPDAQAISCAQHVSFFSTERMFLFEKKKLAVTGKKRSKRSAFSVGASADLVVVAQPILKAVELEQLELLEKQKEIAQAPKERSHTVRVLLDEQEEGRLNWHLRFPDGFFITQMRRGAKTVQSQVDVEVRSYGSRLFLNGQSLAEPQCLISPTQDVFYFDGKKYQGLLLITRDRGGHWLLINCLDLESYTAAVLGSESWPGWPLEVNKVFAIVSRTYALAMIMSARVNKRPYHIKNTNQHQTYRGMHADALLKEAVAQTKGVFIAYKRRPIIAMFDACCGGVIPAYKTGIDFVSAPYLARKYACTFCRGCKVYSWQAQYTFAELEKLFMPVFGAAVRGLHDVRVHKKDAADLVHSVLVKGSRAATVVSGKKIYSLLKRVKSFCYTVRKEGHTIVFKGRGYGHHLGLCQWGAREMVRQGYSYPEIIQFYYPGTALLRLP